MRRLVSTGLTVAFLLTTEALSGQTEKVAVLSPQSVAAAEKVCGFCHFYEYFDEETGALVEEAFLARGQEILRRLLPAAAEAEVMPPPWSPVPLPEDDRAALIRDLEASLEPSAAVD